MSKSEEEISRASSIIRSVQQTFNIQESHIYIFLGVYVYVCMVSSRPTVKVQQDPPWDHYLDTFRVP